MHIARKRTIFLVKLHNKTIKHHSSVQKPNSILYQSQDSVFIKALLSYNKTTAISLIAADLITPPLKSLSSVLRYLIVIALVRGKKAVLGSFFKNPCKSADTNLKSAQSKS